MGVPSHFCCFIGCHPLLSIYWPLSEISPLCEVCNTDLCMGTPAVANYCCIGGCAPVCALYIKNSGEATMPWYGFTCCCCDCDCCHYVDKVNPKMAPNPQPFKN